MYSPQNIGVWSRFGPYPDTVTGRDQWIDAFKQRASLAGWTPRALSSYFDISTEGPGASPASVFMNCPTTNDGNWAVFDNGRNLKAYVIDHFVADPPSKMGCIVAGAFDGTFTSLGYIETGTTDINAVFNGVLAALSLLGYSYDITGTRKARVKNNTVTNSASSVTFSSQTQTGSPSNGQFMQGGYVLRSQPSTRTVYKSGTAKTYGLNNDLELAITQSNLGASASMRIMAARRFITYPWDQPVASGGAITVTGPADGSPDQYRSLHNVLRPDTLEWIFYGSPFTIMARRNTNTGADGQYIHAFALKLHDGRKTDTQDLPFDEATFYGSSFSGSNIRDLAHQGWLGEKTRAAIRSNYGYYKIRYHENTSIAGKNTAQIYALVPGRWGSAIGTVTDGPWVTGYRQGFEPWFGFGIGTGLGSDPTIVAGQIWDCFGLHEDTADPVNSPLFQHDGQYFKKWSRGVSSNITTPFTLCCKVTVIV